MKIVSLDELTEEMVLARPLYRDINMILLHEGVGDLKRYRKNLEKFNFQYFCVDETSVPDSEIAAADLAEMQLEGQKVAAEILEIILADGELQNQGEWQKWMEEVVQKLFCSETILKNIMDLKKRDINLYMHAVNVAVLAVKIGKAMQYTVKQQLILGNGAMLHDIGMLLISDTLRQKSMEMMNDTELKIYHTHTQIGGEMLKNVEDVDELSRLVVMQHHEQMDGHGYPFGVSVDKLHEMSRIVAVCDAYDDLIRKGKNGVTVSPGEAVEYLIVDSGTKYDRKIVEYFLTNVSSATAAGDAAARLAATVKTEVEAPRLEKQDGFQSLARQQAKVESQILKRYKERFEKTEDSYFCEKTEVSARNIISVISLEQVREEAGKIAGEVLAAAPQTQTLRLWQEAMIDGLLANKLVLIHMAELKRLDFVLYAHSIRVAGLSLLLGKALRYKDAQLICLGSGAILHDIGKGLLAESLRHKEEAALNGEERKIYQLHPRLGHEILMAAEQVDEFVKLIVLQHHEPMDTRRYSQAFRDNKIDEMIRIVAICDVYDHLMGGKELPAGNALKILVANAKSALDKGIVKELAKQLPILAQEVNTVLPQVDGKKSLMLPAASQLKKFSLQKAQVRNRIAYPYKIDSSVAAAVWTEGLRALDLALQHFVVNNELHALNLASWAKESVKMVLANRSVMAHMSEIQRRDAKLYMHSISVSVLAMALGKALGYTAKQLSILGEGAMLHDIGMLLLPEALRHKVYYQLRGSERKLYHIHTSAGYKLLRHREDIDRISEIVALRHHERLDGKGYPHGVDGGTIDEWVRIVSICDVYDDLTRQSQGGGGMPAYQVVEYMVANSGVRFDKVLLAEFLKFIMLFPSGSTVVLNDGRKAMVEKQNKNFPARPNVRLLEEGNEISLDLMKEINLVIKKFA